MYTPRYARINLTTGEIAEYSVSRAYYEKYLGGKTLAARLLLDTMPPGLDPLDPRAVVIVNTGPLNGTGAPCSSRFNVTFKNVLTGGIASSNCGGPFGVMLKKAGFDGLIIYGRAEKPVRIEALDGEISIIDASELWGLDCEETQEKLPKAYGKLVTGPAGENLVRFAGLASGERMAGRCGPGAVFGSKMLKALTAYGTAKPYVAKPEKYHKYVQKWVRFVQNHSMTGDALPHYGSAGLVSKANASHALPTRNFKFGHDDEAELVCGETLAETHLVRNSGCVSCPIRCERRVMLDGREVKGPEYETVGFFGPNIGAHDLDVICRLNYVCDILGLDTISAASTIAYAMELFEDKGVDFGVRFGDVSNLEEVLRKTARREGIYDELANGSKWLSEKYGGEEYAMHAKGLEMASYEPRRSVGMGLGYATSNRGGCHLNGGYLALLESVGVLTVAPQKPNSKGELAVFMQNALETVSAAGCCLFSAQTFVPDVFFKLGPHHWGTRLVGKVFGLAGPVVRLLLATGPLLRLNTLYILPHSQALKLCTGLPIGTGSFLRIGERSYNLERMFSVREGLTGADDSLPARMTQTPQVEGDPTTVVPLDKMLPAYYKTRGWKDGVPTKRRLKKLGIEN